MYRFDVNLTLVTELGQQYEYVFEVVDSSVLSAIHNCIQGMEMIFNKMTVSYVSCDSKGEA